MSLTVLIPLLLLVAAANAEALEIHVSPDGSDADQGTAEQPFATIARAQTAVREARARLGEEPISVVLHGGVHRLAEPLRFTPLDSGTPEGPVTYRPHEGEEVVISGGRTITGWRPHEGALSVADVPWVRERAEPFTQLFVNGARRPRARTPNEGEYFYSRPLAMQGDLCTGLTYAEDDLGPWAQDGLICLFHNWVNSYNRIAVADWERRRLVFERPAGIFFLGPSVRYYVENVFEALDAPGEWYLDHEAGRLYYHPLPGEDVTTAEVIAPVLPSPMIELRGEPRLGLYVEHLEFAGVSFQHTEANLSPDYPHSVQGADTQRGAIVARGARTVTIRDCEFSHLGEHAVSLLEGCADNTITRCRMHDLGGGGVYLSEGAAPSDDEGYLTVRTRVDNNLIHNGGITFRAACGVFLGGGASHNTITHNEVCDMSWVGVHVGWSWTGLQPAYTHHNEVAYNHLHHLGNGVLNDIGGIYTLGVSPGTVLHHNLIHDVTRFERGDEGYGGWGIYLDAGSSEIVVEDNVVYNTRDGGLHLHNFGHPYGDIIRNNIFAYSDEGQMMRNADHEPETWHARIERNIVYGANERMLWGGNWAPESRFSADYNVYFSEATDSPDFNGLSLAEWQATGRDVNSIVADPLFVDATGYDFRLRDDSPALKLGFAPIDISGAGLYGDPEWTRLVDGIVHRAVETATPPVETAGALELDFADYESGETPDGAIAPDGDTRVIVVEDASAVGARCLRFDDGPAQDAWKPHWFMRRTPGDGPVRLTYVVRNDAQRPAPFELEVRDWRRMAGVTYATGPHIRFESDGAVLAADGPTWRAISSYALGEWVHVEVEFEEGEGRAGVYSVRPGADAEWTHGLAFRTEAFEEANWIGFCGVGSEHGSFYVDQVRIGTVAERAFRMGFTPFPYDMTLEAVADTRQFLRDNADIVAAHFEGVPWPEALSGEPFRRNVAENFGMTREAIPDGATVYLAVTPINILRSGLAAYRGDTEGLPVPEPFAGKAFDDPLIKEAYLKYCRRAMEYFEPDYLSIGVEVNELHRNSPDLWAGYIELHRATYQALKEERPDLPIFVSFTLHDLLNPDRTPDERESALKALEELMPCNDLIAISFYPFLGLLTARVDACLAWLDSTFGGYGKPYAVAEMGEIAEPLHVESLNFTIPGAEDTQQAMLEGVLRFAHSHAFRFMVWFVPRDYDALSERLGGGVPAFFHLWKDAGLLSGDGRSRPAHELWRSHFLQRSATEGRNQLTQ